MKKTAMAVLLILAIILTTGCASRYSYRGFDKHESGDKNHFLLDEVEYSFWSVKGNYYRCGETSQEFVCVKECDNGGPLACPHINPNVIQ